MTKIHSVAVLKTEVSGGRSVRLGSLRRLVVVRPSRSTAPVVGGPQHAPQSLPGSRAHRQRPRRAARPRLPLSTCVEATASPLRAGSQTW